MRSGFRQDLEEEILRQHRRLYGRKGWWGRRLNPVPGLGTPALVVIFLVILGLGAGAVPASYRVEMGATVSIRVPGDPGAVPGLEELLGFLRESAVAEEISVSVSARAGEGAEIHLILFGRRIREEELNRLLVRRFPVLNTARVRFQGMEETVRGNLAEWVGHALFRIEVNVSEVEEARERILEELAARGYRSATRVEVREDDGNKRIEVQLDENE